MNIISGVVVPSAVLCVRLSCDAYDGSSLVIISDLFH